MSEISSNDFGCDNNSVPVQEIGMKEGKIHLHFTSQLKYLKFCIICYLLQPTGQIEVSVR